MQSRPLKILMTADPIGGVWTYALELIRTWQQAGIEVALATLGAALSPEQQAEVEAFPQVRHYPGPYKLEWMEEPWEEVAQAADWLMAIKETFDPDLIHLNNLAHGGLNWQKPVVMVVHSCVLSWWQAVKKEKAPPAWDTYRERVTAGLQAADLVVAPSRAMLLAAETQYGPFRASRVIYNGRQPGLFQIKAKEPFIFSMGRIWDEAKNLGLLARLAEDLHWPVYLAGEARHPVTGQQLPLPNVHFLGQLGQPAISDFLSRAAIFVSPARYDPFGLAALEAAMSGCALVLSNLDSYREIWQEAAGYVRPDDAGDLKGALERLMNDAPGRDRMGRIAFRQAQQYGAGQMAFAYLQAYQSLLPAAVIKATASKAGLNIKRPVLN